MNYRRLFGLMVMTCCLASCGASLPKTSYLQEYGGRGGRGQGWRQLPYHASQEAHYCVPGKISGRITRLRPETFLMGMEPGLALDVQTPDRGLVHIHLGPLWLLDRQEADLKPGDEVSLKAFCYNLAGQERLLAAEITHKGNTLVLRDVQGTPYWDAWRKK